MKKLLTCAAILAVMGVAAPVLEADACATCSPCVAARAAKAKKCGEDCTKECCATKEVKKCGSDCTRTCCVKEKAKACCGSKKKAANNK